MNNKLFYKIIFAISTVIFIISLIMIIKLFLPEENAMTEFKNDTTTTSSDTTTSAEEPTSVMQLPDNPINFRELKETNNDVYSWIEIPGTTIDYPVVQSSKDKSDLFYLDHNIYEEYEFAGTIFSQKKNSRNYQDPVTVLYGHNMLNGTMFADLDKFRDTDFFNEHDIFYIYMPGHILTYKIVSAYVYDNRHIINTFDFSKEDDLKEYIDSVIAPKSFVSNVRADINITTQDKIVTLSTCTGNDSQRYLVQGVLQDDQLTK